MKSQGGVTCAIREACWSVGPPPRPLNFFSGGGLRRAGRGPRTLCSTPLTSHKLLKVIGSAWEVGGTSHVSADLPVPPLEVQFSLRQCTRCPCAHACGRIMGTSG